MKLITKKKDKYITFKNKKYAINLDKLREVCLTSSNSGGTNEMEISQVYEVQEGGDFNLSSKVEHETKTIGNPQNDMIIYDIVKLLIVSLLDYNAPEGDFDWPFSLTISVNTLLSWGVLEELE